MRAAWLLICAAAFPAIEFGASPTITHPSIARSEDGTPVYAPESFVGGETVHFSFYVEGYTRVGNAVKLNFDAQPKDAEGVALAPVESDEEPYILTPEDRDWKPKLRGSFLLPSVLAAGTYHIELKVTDVFSHQTASRDLSFLVSGIEVPKTANLAILGLAFYRNDDDEKPLSTAAYRLTEEVHARFQIVGFRRSEKGPIDVVYGISVADAEGRVLFGEANAAEDKSDEFYPKPFVPGILAFSVKPGTPPGDYVLTVTARDLIGNQTAEAHGSLRFE